MDKVISINGLQVLGDGLHITVTHEGGRTAIYMLHSVGDDAKTRIETADNPIAEFESIVKSHPFPLELR